MKFWLKLIKNEKIVWSDTITYDGGPLDAGGLNKLLKESLLAADLPSPNVLHSHMAHLSLFNVTRFRPEDFVEHVDFDSLTVEIIRSDKPRK